MDLNSDFLSDGVGSGGLGKSFGPTLYMKMHEALGSAAACRRTPNARRNSAHF
jgi:hypothetical protein